MKIEIVVKVKNGKKYFYHQESGMYFDRLRAFDKFAGGQFEVQRGKEKFRAVIIEEYGTHGACTCFYSHGIPLDIYDLPITVIEAATYGVDDKLVITSRAKDVNLAQLLYQDFIVSYRFKILPVGKKMMFSEFADKLKRGVDIKINGPSGEKLLKDLKVLNFSEV